MEETISEYNLMTRKRAWLGEYTLDALKELLDGQFSDYIGVDDRNNYVAIFYEQVDISRRGVYDEEDRTELNEAIDNILEEFVAFIMNRFNARFNVHATDYESGNFTYAEIRPVIEMLYEFFITNGRRNFIDYFTREIPETMKMMNADPSRAYDEAEEILDLDIPYIRSSDVLGFLKKIGDTDILEMYESNDLTGNFLTKYSPHFDRHEDLRQTILTNAAVAYQLTSLMERKNHGETNETTDDDPDS